MAKKIIDIDLSNVDKAIAELADYKKDLQSKIEKCQKRITEEIVENARNYFASAVVDDLVDGSYRDAEVEVTSSTSGDISVIIASGNDAIFVEFGAGKHHNGSVGKSPNPFVKEFPDLESQVAIGSYGQGRGQYDWWLFKDKDGEIQKTHGTPAQMPMYNACIDVINDIESIVREVFG